MRKGSKDREYCYSFKCILFRVYLYAYRETLFLLSILVKISNVTTLGFICIIKFQFHHEIK